MSGISRELLLGVNALHSASRFSEEEGIDANTDNKGDNQAKEQPRKKPKFQLKGFALGFNAVLKNNHATETFERIEERDEEFKTTGT